MRRVLTAILVTLVLGTGCSSGSGPAPGGSATAPPAASDTPPAPVETAPRPTNEVGTPKPPTQTGPPALPFPCRRDSYSQIVEPAGPESPVKASVYLEDDPGIASPVLTWVSSRLMTLHVQFSGPVARDSFHLAFFENNCSIQRPVAQAVRWLSDHEAVIEVTEPPPVHSEFAVTLGAGKDPEGNEVREPVFYLQIMREMPTMQVVAQPLEGGEPRVIFERTDVLTARSVSPDGRYLLAVREPVEIRNSPDTTKIPYIFDLQTGAFTSYPQAPVEQIRWDLGGRIVWINGWQRLSLDSAELLGADLLQRLPPGGGRRLYAEVSPDGRWLAVLRARTPDDMSDKAELVMLELATGKYQVLPSQLGWPVDGPPTMYVDWAPDSSALLLSSYDRGEVPTFTLIDPVTLTARPLPVALKEYSLAGFSPGGKYILVGRYGIITPDGKPVLEEPRLWSGFWSPDDRFLLLYGENDTFELLEVATGARRSIPRPKNFGLVLDFAADGSAIYFAGRVTQ